MCAQQQDSIIPIQNGGFEDWPTGNGYSVTVLFFPCQLFPSIPQSRPWAVHCLVHRPTTQARASLQY